ncbi:hypothetical protein ACFL22_00690 [Patescibacteria group bacterium]
MEDFIIYIFLFIIISVVLLIEFGPGFLPVPTNEMQEKNPIFFWFIIIVGTLSFLVFLADIFVDVGGFIKMIDIFIKDGCFICD